MINIYCARPSKGARTLVRTIRALGGEARRVRQRVPDAFVWGRGGGNKYHELQRLHAAGIPVPAHIQLPRYDTTYAGLWLGRQFHHTQARDLLHPNTFVPDFLVEHIATVREHRIHVFDGRVIRVQTKQPTPGAEPHPWIRSESSGWTLVARPDLTALVPRGARDIAKRAVSALGYDYGAVDLAVKPDGGVIVWEVNTQPGLGDGTAVVYARILLQKYGG